MKMLKSNYEYSLYEQYEDVFKYLLKTKISKIKLIGNEFGSGKLEAVIELKNIKRNIDLSPFKGVISFSKIGKSGLYLGFDTNKLTQLYHDTLKKNGEYRELSIGSEKYVFTGPIEEIPF